MAPYLMKGYANGGSTAQEQHFGLPLRRGRMVSECASGKLKTRFGALRRAMDFKLDDFPFIIYAYLMHRR